MRLAYISSAGGLSAFRERPAPQPGLVGSSISAAAGSSADRVACTHAAQQGHRVKHVLAAKLVNELVEADERQLSKTIARYGRVDLLCLDEYMELDRRGAELLFQVLTEREETNSVAIASNESFSGWTKTFTAPRLCSHR